MVCSSVHSDSWLNAESRRCGARPRRIPASGGDQRDAHAAAPGIRAVARRAQDSCPGSTVHIVFSVQPARELGVVDRRAHPEVERRRPASRTRARRLQQRQHGANFSRVEAPVLRDVRSSLQAAIEARCTARLIARAVIGAVEEELLAAAPRRRRRSPSACPGAFERFDRLEKTTSRSKSSRPSLRAACSAPERRLAVEVDLRVALVGGDDEAVAVGRARTARFHSSSVITRAAGIAGRADVDSCSLHASAPMLELGRNRSAWSQVDRRRAPASSAAPS